MCHTQKKVKEFDTAEVQQAWLSSIIRGIYTIHISAGAQWHDNKIVQSNLHKGAICSVTKPKKEK